MLPEVSVVMAVYNDERFIAEAVNSILSSTLSGDMEVIIVDDGSTDSSYEMLTRYTDPRLKVLRHDTNQGLTRSLVDAIDRSRGVYIARMDSDDISMPWRLERQASFLRANPEYGLVGCRYIIIDERGEELTRVKLPETNEELQRELVRWNPFCHGAVMFRRDVFFEVGGYRSAFMYGQDYDLWLRISERYKVYNLPEYLYKWRIRSGNIAVQKRHIQREFGRLSRLCANRRRQGLPEPDLFEWQRKIMGNVMEPMIQQKRFMDSEIQYAVMVSRIMMENGSMRHARQHLLGLLRNGRRHPSLLLLCFLSFLPRPIYRILNRDIPLFYRQFSDMMIVKKHK